MPKRVANPDSVEDDDGEVEYKRNLPSFGGIKTIAEKREVKKKSRYSLFVFVFIFFEIDLFV